MKLTRKHAVNAVIFSVLALATLAIMGYPIVPPEMLGAIGILPFMGDTADVSLAEIKTLVEQQGTTWNEHKKVQSELLAAKADGKSVEALEARAAKIEKELDAISEIKSRLDALVLASQRPGAGGAKDEAVEAEVKQFNIMLQADFQSKGRTRPSELDADAYAQYKSAFFELARHGNVELLTADQRKAMSAGSDPDGGLLLPAATVGRTVKKLYEQSSMRQLATVVPLSTNDLEGVVDNNEADAGWVSEMGARNDTNTPQVGKYRIEAHEMYAQPKATQKLIDDSATDIEAWLSGKVADKFARVEGDAFCNGNGIEKPRGLFTYLTAATGDSTRAWGTFEHILTGASADFHTTKADPLQDMIGAFKDQYLQAAIWLMRREVRTKVRKMKEATSDRYLWEPSMQVGQPDRLLGYPVKIDQYVPAIAANSLSLAFGDFKEAYTIVDRMGMRTLRDPFTAKPYVRFYTTKRTGGGAINFEAVKFLKFGA